MNMKILAFTALAGYASAISGPIVKEEASANIPRDFTGQRFPRFSNGYILAYDFDLAKVWAYDRHGKALIALSLTTPEVTHIQIHDIAAAKDGTVAVAASAMNDEGNMAPVIFWITPGGAITRVVRTAPFSASRIVFANDGSLWAAGRVYTLDGSKFVAAPKYDVLRRYDSQGRLQQTAVPNTIFAGTSMNPAVDSLLVSSQDRIAFLSVPAKQYVEISLSGDPVGHWGINSPLPNNELSGMALTPSGDVFVSMLPHADSQKPYEGPPFYQLDKLSGSLQPVQLSISGMAKPTVLLGNDGDKLVFYSKPPASISWFSVQ